MEPFVVECVLDPNDAVVKRVGNQEYKRAMSSATAETIRDFMVSVVNDPRGTGGAARIPGVLVAGKTGTAETSPGQNPHAWFIAFAPAEAPKYAVAGANTFLTITGTSLGNAATGNVTINGLRCAIAAATQWSGVKILCAIPVDVGWFVPVQVFAADQVSNVKNFTYYPLISQFVAP